MVSAKGWDHSACRGFWSCPLSDASTSWSVKVGVGFREVSVVEVHEALRAWLASARLIRPTHREGHSYVAEGHKVIRELHLVRAALVGRSAPTRTSGPPGVTEGNKHTPAVRSRVPRGELV